jgi:hypothetical protein
LVASRAKAVERPEILPLVVTQHVIIAVIGEHAEIAGVGGIPSAVEFLNQELASAKDKPERAFVRTVPRITLDANLAHRASAGWKGVHRRRTCTAYRPESISFGIERNA